MNLKFLETFLWVAKLRSFSLAAEKLHSTQAAISSRILALEEELGTRLLVRDPKGVRLTRAGESVLQYAEQVRESIARMRASLSSDANVGGSVRIGAMDTVIHSWFVDFITDLSSRHPNLDVEITSDTALNLHEQLRRGMLDVTFQTDMIRDETIRSEELMRLPIAWIVAANSPAATRLRAGSDNCPLHRIAQERLITFSRHSQPHQDLQQLLQSEGIGDAKISCVNSVAALIKLTLAGFGIAAIPPALVCDLISAQALQILDCGHVPPPMPVVVSWRIGTEWTERLVNMAEEAAEKYAMTHVDYVRRPAGGVA